MHKPSSKTVKAPRYKTSKLKSLRPNVTISGDRVNASEGIPTWWHLARILPARPMVLRPYNGPGTISVTLEVQSGSVGVVLWMSGDSEKQIDAGNVAAVDGKGTIELFAPDLSKVGPLVFRNDGPPNDRIEFRITEIHCNSLDLGKAIDGNCVLHALYDLSIFPHTYDFAYFVMAAELARHRAGLESMHVHLVRPGREAVSRLPEGFHSAIGDQAREWRVDNILSPILSLFPSVRGYSVWPDAAAAYAMHEYCTHIYPRNLDPTVDTPIHVVYRDVNANLRHAPGALRPRASAEALRYVEQWLAPRARGRKPIVITLRQYGFLAARNSNVEAWLTFARELDSREYFPVIVPDTATAMEMPADYGDIAAFPEGSFHLPLRMALYQSAFMNLATTGGPPMLLTISDCCPFLYFKHVIRGVRLCSEEHLTDVGFVVGEDLPHLRQDQHYVWADDDLPVIRREFQAMLSRLKQSGNQ